MGFDGVTLVVPSPLRFFLPAGERRPELRL
ncbi:MAG: hypothetical protein QOK15_1741, partial [Nocardioidaceae bacterium]|nr:hypothetical protein [Nocardioidaceae bacterium]